MPFSNIIPADDNKLYLLLINYRLGVSKHSESLYLPQESGCIYMYALNTVQSSHHQVVSEM